MIRCGEMAFNFRDIYPDAVGEETSTTVIPEAEDAEVLNENADDAQKVRHGASNKKLIVGAVLMIGAVVLLGGVK